MTAPVLAALGGAFAAAAGNPSSHHAEGQAARRLLEESRSAVARFAGARPEEVVFTSGGSESNNAAIGGILAGAARARPGHAPRIVTSAVEHPSILRACERAGREGAQVEILPVDDRGLLDPGDLKRSLEERPAHLVSVIHVNNETGVIQPIEELAGIAAEAGAIFHTDAVQAAGRLDLAGELRSIPAFSLAAHKIGGPPGIGALILRRGTPFEPWIAGGAQEGGKRAGTETAALAVAFARAAALVEVPGPARERIGALRDRMERALGEIAGGCRIHGAGAPRVSNTTSAYIPSAPGRLLVIRMDLEGFAVSTGSACSTGSSRPSHVLRAMGRPEHEALDSLRVSLGPETSSGEVDSFLASLARAIETMHTRGESALAGAEVA